MGSCILMGRLPLVDTAKHGLVTIEGNAALFTELPGMIDDFQLLFPVIEPRQVEQ